MSGVSIKVNVTDNGVIKVADGLLNKLANHEPLLYIIGATVEASVQRNFEKEGRPQGWAPLAPATLLTKPNDKILQVKGHAGGLLGSIHAKVAGKVVRVGTNKIYGAIHQFGGQAGRGHKVTIPARPYLLVQDEDLVEIRALANEYFAGDFQ